MASGSKRQLQKNITINYLPQFCPDDVDAQRRLRRYYMACTQVLQDYELVRRFYRLMSACSDSSVSAAI